MANFVYNNFKEGLLVGSFNLQGTPTIRVLLATNSYTPDIDAHIYRSSISGTLEVVGTNYTSGGVALSSPNVQQDDTGNAGALYGTNILWTPITASSIAYAVCYGSSGNGAASDPLYFALDLGTDSSTANFWAVTGGTFLISFTNPILQAT